MPCPVDDDRGIRPEPFLSVIGIPQLARSVGDLDMEDASRGDARVILEGADTGQPTAHSPGSEDLRRLIGACVPALANADDSPSVPGRDVDRAVIDAPRPQLAPAHDAAQPIDDIEK